MNAIGIVSTCAVGALLSASAASGGVIMQTMDFGPGIPNFSETLTFDQYNGADELLSIKVKVFLQIRGGQLIVDNDGVDPAVVEVELGATAAISSTDVMLLDAAFQPVTGTASASTGDLFNLAGNVGDGDLDFDGTAPDGAIHDGDDADDMKMGFINPSFFSEFEGAGTFDILASIAQILDFGGIGGVEGAFTPVTASGNVMIIYDYIPAPGAAALFGVAGLVGIRRRR